LLLVEVSDSSLAYDQGIKRALYARHGVAEYWVVDIPGQRVHVYREPTGEGYAQALEHAADDIVSPRALPSFQVAARKFFT
jgi:Uma2 family endonuclease